VAAQALLGSTEPIGKLRGRVHLYRGIRLIATYHPAALLRNQSLKRPTWEDMKLLRREYDGLEL
jgi:DNA polymerase